jgi:DNA-3-methyladenine glycosylase II
LQRAVKAAYKMKRWPTKKQLIRLAEPWRPYRTVASWYLWRAADAGEGGW